MVSLVRREGFQQIGQQLESALRIDLNFTLVIFGSEFFGICEQTAECGFKFIRVGSVFQYLPPGGLNFAAVRNPLGCNGLDLQVPGVNRLELGFGQAS
ncbi:MAG: hypothetical protein P8Y74_04805 [Desulfobacterales bacterium]